MLLRLTVYSTTMESLQNASEKIMAQHNKKYFYLQAQYLYLMYLCSVPTIHNDTTTTSHSNCAQWVNRRSCTFRQMKCNFSLIDISHWGEWDLFEIMTWSVLRRVSMSIPRINVSSSCSYNHCPVIVYFWSSKFGMLSTFRNFKNAWNSFFF